MKKIVFYIILSLLVVTVFVLGGCSNSSPTGSGSEAVPKIESIADLVQKVQDTATQMQGISLDYVMTESDKTISSGKIWGQPSNKMMRVETTINKIQDIIIINENEKSVIIYQPDKKTGKKVDISTYSQLADLSYEDYVNNIDPKATDLGNEDVNGEKCRVIQYTSNDKSTITMWIREKLNFPSRIKTVNADGIARQSDYTNIIIGTLPADTFIVPAGISIHDQTTSN